MIAHKQKGSDQFMHISNNTEYSRYENFDLTRMFNKQCFVIQIYQAAMVDYIWIISLENTKAKCRHFLFVKQEIERQSTCKK